MNPANATNGARNRAIASPTPAEIPTLDLCRGLRCSTAIALGLLAIMALYGLKCQLAHEREREVGIRLALGTDYAGIVALMLGNSGRVLALALAAGLAGSVAVRVILQTTMPGLPSLSPVTVTAIARLLAAADLLAAYLPSRRAARNNPADVLRSE